MMQQFIFKTVPAGHKATLQSAEHKRAKKGGGGGTWCTQKETAPHHRCNIKSQKPIIKQDNVRPLFWQK